MPEALAELLAGATERTGLDEAPGKSGATLERVVIDGQAYVLKHLDLTNAIHVGHSTGGGEVARYIGRHSSLRVANYLLRASIDDPDIALIRSNPLWIDEAFGQPSDAQRQAALCP